MLDHPNGIKLLRVVDKEKFSRFFTFAICAASFAVYISGQCDGPIPHESDSLRNKTAKYSHFADKWSFAE